MADLTKLSDDALLERSYKLQAKRDEIREEQLAIHAERGRRADMAALASVPPGVRDLILQGATAEGTAG